MAAAFGDAGIATDLFFVGAPEKPGIEMQSKHVRLRRWCQWISHYHPGNVYDAEWDKAQDYARSAPPVICAEIVAPARERGEHVLIIGEDWQIVPTMLQLDADLHRWGLRSSATLLWNANNTYGFWGIDWHALQRACTITCVSKYMKFELGVRGIPALVIPNGIPARLLERDDTAGVKRLRRAFDNRRMLLKVGRYDPDKRWIQAIDAVANLREKGLDAALIIRGGREWYRETVLGHARWRSLRIDEVSMKQGTPEELSSMLASCEADVIELRTFVPDTTLYALYGAVDAVLANSGREPFGLVGLEVMAAHGIAVCGSTGEDYAQPFDNALVCDTDDPRELSTYLEMLFSDAALTKRLRKGARSAAERYSWPAVLEMLAAKLKFLEGR